MTRDFAPEGFTNIAVADDDGMTETARRTWVLLGYSEPRVFTSLEEALRKTRHNRPSILLCDHRLGDAGPNGVRLMEEAVADGIPVVVAISSISVPDTKLPPGVVNATGEKHNIYKLHDAIWGRIRKLSPATKPCTPPPVCNDTILDVSSHIFTLADELPRLYQRLELARRTAERAMEFGRTEEVRQFAEKAWRTIHGLEKRQDWTDPRQRTIYLTEFRNLNTEAHNLAELQEADFRKTMHDLIGSLGAVDAAEPETLEHWLPRILPHDSLAVSQREAVQAWLSSTSRFSPEMLLDLASFFRVPVQQQRRPSEWLGVARFETDDTIGVQLVIIEDEPSWRSIVQQRAARYFRSSLREGHCVTCADGNAGLEQVRKWAKEYENRKNPQIPSSSLVSVQPVFCVDLALPDNGPQGLDVLREIRSSRLTCPVIVLTSGADSQEIRREIRLLGVEATDYLLKQRGVEECLDQSLDRWLRCSPRIDIQEREERFYFDGLSVDDLTEGEKEVLRKLMATGWVTEAGAYMEYLTSVFDDRQHLVTIGSLVANNDCAHITEAEEMLEWLSENHPRKVESFVRAQTRLTGDPPDLLPVIRDLMLRLREMRVQRATLQDCIYKLRDKVWKAYAANGRQLDPYRDFIIQERGGYRLAWDSGVHVDGDQNGPIPAKLGRKVAQRTTRRPTRVLVLEDDDSWRDMVTREFRERLLCEVQSASTVLDAFEKAMAFKPDILCVDMLVPYYEGDDSPADHLAGLNFLNLVHTLLPESIAVVLSDWTNDDLLNAVAENAGVSLHDLLPKNAGWNDALLRSVWRIETELSQSASVLPPLFPPPVVELTGTVVRTNGKVLSGKQADLLTRLALAHPSPVSLGDLQGDDHYENFKTQMRHVRSKLVIHLPKAEQDRARKWVVKETSTREGTAYLLNAIVRRQEAI